MLEVHWEGEGRSSVKRQFGLELTVTNLKQGESHWKRKTPGDKQPMSLKLRVLSKAAAVTGHQ